MIIAGVDCGIRGGLAIVAVENGAAPVLVECVDIPTVGVGAKERVDVAAIRNFIDRHKPICALIERAQEMPKQGASSVARSARSKHQSRCVRSRSKTSSRPRGNDSGNYQARTKRAGDKRRCSCFRLITACWRGVGTTIELNPH
jgi:hypothetical protein